MRQGQSEYTQFKEHRFGPILAQSIKISKAAAVAKYPYYHIDLNSGSGFNEQVQVEGSPLNFLGAIERHGRPNFYAFFVDNDLKAIAPLTRRLEKRADLDRINIFHADNSEILPIVSAFVATRERSPQYSIGSIVIDPNGWHKGVPWGQLQQFCKERSKTADENLEEQPAEVQS